MKCQQLQATHVSKDQPRRYTSGAGPGVADF